MFLGLSFEQQVSSFVLLALVSYFYFFLLQLNTAYY